MKKPYCFVLFLFWMFGSGPRSMAQDTCNGMQLPKGVRSAVERKFPRWRILQLNDLAPDDRKLWLKEHPAECPGVASGHFEGPSLTSYAITLFEPSSKPRQVLVVVTPYTRKGARLQVLSPPETESRLLVVYRTPPGNYEQVEDGTIRIRYDAIAYEAIEAGIIVYYFAKGKYHTVQTSE